MRAAVLIDKDIPAYHEFREPVPVDGQRLVTVTAAGINPIDLFLAKTHTAQPGFDRIVPGREGVGLVEGKRVYFASAPGAFGSMAEKSLAADHRMIDVPDAISDADALSMGIAGLTAWLSLSHSAGLKPGEHVLILGASGAVGMLAVQAARLMGAGRIIAAARSERGLEDARRSGADETVLLADGMDVQAAFRSASAGRIDVILDPIWGPVAIAALQAATAGVRMVQIGNSAGAETPFNPAFMRMGEKEILGFSSSAVSASDRAEVFGRLCRYRLSGEMGIDVETVPLRHVADGFRRQAGFPYKKLVLEI